MLAEPTSWLKGFCGLQAKFDAVSSRLVEGMRLVWVPEPAVTCVPRFRSGDRWLGNGAGQAA